VEEGSTRKNSLIGLWFDFFTVMNVDEPLLKLE